MRKRHFMYWPMVVVATIGFGMYVWDKTHQPTWNISPESAKVLCDQYTETRQAYWDKYHTGFTIEGMDKICH